MTNIKNLCNINQFYQTITCQHINSFYPTTTTHTLENCGIDSYILESHQEWIDEETIHCFHAQNEYLFPYKTWGEIVVGSQSGESTSTPCAIPLVGCLIILVRGQAERGFTKEASVYFWYLDSILFHTVHYATLPFRHSAIPPFRHSAIPPFCHSAIPPFRHSATPPFRHSAIPLQYAITRCMYHKRC